MCSFNNLPVSALVSIPIYAYFIALAALQIIYSSYNNNFSSTLSNSQCLSFTQQNITTGLVTSTWMILNGALTLILALFALLVTMNVGRKYIYLPNFLLMNLISAFNMFGLVILQSVENTGSWFNILMQVSVYSNLTLCSIIGYQFLRAMLYKIVDNELLHTLIPSDSVSESQITAPI